MSAWGRASYATRLEPEQALTSLRVPSSRVATRQAEVGREGDATREGEGWLPALAEVSECCEEGDGLEAPVDQEQEPAEPVRLRAGLPEEVEDKGQGEQAGEL